MAKNVVLPKAFVSRTVPRLPPECRAGSVPERHPGFCSGGPSVAVGHQHQLQRQRFELKYLIDEATARRVRDFARCHLMRDDHAIPELRYAYPI